MVTPGSTQPGPQPPSSAPPLGPGERLVRVGGIVFLLGMLAVVMTITPLLLGTERLPRLFYLLSLLTPIGLGLALAGLLVQARAGRRPR